jgi:hypothetical protein
MILKGIKIYSEKTIKDRVMLSEGTCLTKKVNNVLLDKPVFIPTGNWRLPNVSEKKILQKRWHSKFEYNQINILKLDRITKRTLQQVGFQFCSSSDEVNYLLKSNEWNEAKNSLILFANKYMSRNSILIDSRVSFKRGGLRSTTQDNPKTGQYNGLHLDSSKQYNFLSERETASNRICFNMGKYPRHLCFINLDLKRIFNYSNDANNFSSLTGADYSFIWKFLKENCQYPVIRVKVEPFEAYIAPTENIIHDGDSEGILTFDIVFTLWSKYYYNPSYYQIIKNIKL